MPWSIAAMAIGSLCGELRLEEYKSFYRNQALHSLFRPSITEYMLALDMTFDIKFPPEVGVSTDSEEVEVKRPLWDIAISNVLIGVIKILERFKS